MPATIFAVSDEPYCLWDEDVAERTRAFLDGFDSGFFLYLLDVHGASEDEKRASVGVRLALHHAKETLFSLLGAFIQAPDCPYAWIAKCSNLELRAFVNRVSSGDADLITKWAKPFLNWESVAAAVLQSYEAGTDKQTRTIQCFGRAWAAIAGDFISEVMIDEYNATKHGFRTRPGGFSLGFSREEVPGTVAPGSEMTTLGSSEFGAMFFKVEKLSGKGGRHIRSRRNAVNWSIERDVLLLQLTQYSIHNVISALKVLNGSPPGSCTFVRPVDDEDFDRPWKYSTGVTSMNFDFVLDEATLPEVTKGELLAALRGNSNRKE